MASPPSSQRSRTARFRRSGAPRSRRPSPRRRSCRTGWPSSGGRSRSCGVPPRTSRRRPACGHASKRSTAPLTGRRSHASSSAERPRPSPSASVSPSSSSVPALPPSASRRRSRAHRSRLRATGRATLTKTPSGWRVELRATGLPRLDNGRFYEAWLKDAAGVLVPIGTFNDGHESDVVGRGLAEAVRDADRDPRTSRRQSSLLGREGARRGGRDRRLTRGPHTSGVPSNWRTICCRAR